MRMRKLPRRLIAVVIGSVCVSGCSSIFSDSILDQSVQLPTPSNVHEYMALFQPFSTGPIQSGSDYVWAGYAYSDHHCNAYFSALEKAKIQAAFFKDATSSAFSAADTIMALAVASQQAIGIVAAAGSFIGNVMTSYNNQFFFAQHSGALWNQVVIAQNKYKFEDVAALYNTIKEGPIASPTVAAVAHNIVQNYARLCTLQQLDLFVSTALTTRTASASDKPKDQSENSNRRLESTGRHRSFHRAPGTPAMPAYVIQ